MATATITTSVDWMSCGRVGQLTFLSSAMTSWVNRVNLPC